MKTIVRMVAVMVFWIGWCNNTYASIVTSTPIMQHRYHKNPTGNRYMNDKDFYILYNKVKKKSFKSDKLELIEVGSLDSRFSCKQCRKILDLFSFDDERLEALKLMAPRIVDVDNAMIVINAMTFESGKKKAQEIILKYNK